MEAKICKIAHYCAGTFDSGQATILLTANSSGSQITIKSLY